MPSVSFVYGCNDEVIGMTAPAVGPIVEAYIGGDITTEEYFALSAEEDAADRALSDFMQGDQPPDFMPKIPRPARWRGWLSKLRLLT